MSSRGNSMFSKTLLACGLGGIALACALPTPASALDSNYKGETTVRCGDLITKSIKLANDLHNCSGNGLEVGAANITIDLNGHTIDGSGTSGSLSGIDNSQAGSRNTGFPGVTIKNGTVTDFARGITLADGANRNVIQRILAIVNGTGIFVRNVDRPHINYSAAGGGTVGIRLESVTNARVERNAALYTLNGILLTGTSRGTVLYRNSVVNNGGDGILVDSTVTGTRIDNNDANGNGDDGIDVNATDSATVIRNNRARNNGDYGIEATPGVTDGGGNHASGNGNAAQCLNIACTP
ncbi:right-handed parallel beta-helix repeat-containing protein [Nonomuraea bangladeshensis]|uniref:right-handed parallel beta-helix repeat-containing protein n=1 Tax=Nonomuraea bangladeshensis TaxID=404385 RepID=UPI003C2B5AFA